MAHQSKLDAVILNVSVAEAYRPTQAKKFLDSSNLHRLVCLLTNTCKNILHIVMRPNKFSRVKSNAYRLARYLLKFISCILVGSLFRKRSASVQHYFWSTLFVLLSIFIPNHAVFADSFFDFDKINAPKKKTAHSAAIDSYMERHYGSDITVGPSTQVVGPRVRGNHGRAAADFSPPSDSFLTNGKGKNSGITLSFDRSPISSFSVDSQVFKRGVGLIIKADGVIVYQHLLTKAEKRSGIMDSIDPIFFDKPIHTLEFIGIQKSKIGIDDLAVNLSQPNEDLGNQLGAEEAIQAASVPEPSSLLMLGLGFVAVSWLSRRFRAKSISSTSKDQQQT